MRKRLPLVQAEPIDSLGVGSVAAGLLSMIGERPSLVDASRGRGRCCSACWAQAGRHKGNNNNDRNAGMRLHPNLPIVFSHEHLNLVSLGRWDRIDALTHGEF